LDSSTILNILKHPNENGIVVFVLGVLFVLSVYHFLLYFQHKDKTYLYYSMYTALIYISHLDQPEGGFISILVKPFVEILTMIDLDLIWAYNMLYFIFAFTFLDLKSFSINWYNFIFRSIYLLFFISILFEVSYRVNGNYRIIEIGDLFFISYLSLLGLISYVPLFKINNPLKYYIIFGSTFLFGSSLAATFIHQLNLVPDGNEINFSIFYIGVIFENILFSLGLGHKQKLILKEKRESQEKLIEQLQENENLRHKIHQQLEQDVALLSKQAEVEKLEALKAKYDKELAELKMTSLRSQMNPHFIFNSLNSIKSYIIENKKENAVYYLNKFSKLIRKILAATMEKEISLADEIETMELYVNIENIRFENEISYTVTVDKNLNIDTIKIPSLILQPFIENAIWHGLASKKGDKKLEIRIEKEAYHFAKITVTDNGVGRERSNEINKKKIHKRNSIGIKLTEERLRNFAKDFHNNYSLTFKDLYDKDGLAKGTEVILKVPFK
jgi:sensor histidine kinase YesM